MAKCYSCNEEINMNCDDKVFQEEKHFCDYLCFVDYDYPRWLEHLQTNDRKTYLFVIRNRAR
jgi:hypothetical protein